MNEDPLQAAWANQPEPTDTPALPTDPAELAGTVAEAHRKDQRRLVWLNVRESATAVIIAVVFAAVATEGVRPWAIRLGALIYLLVGLFLFTSSMRHHRADKAWGSSVRSQLERRLAQLNHRAALYRNVAWWYFVPLGIGFGLVLFGFGVEDGGWPGVAIVLFQLVFSIVMYKKNRQLGRERYESEAERIETLLSDFDEAV